MTLEWIDLSDGTVLDATCRETTLLAALAEDARPLVHNGVYRSYALPPTTLGGAQFSAIRLFH